jgi:hypothetical protein
LWSLLLGSTHLIQAQSVDFDSFKGKPFKITGGIAAGATYTAGSDSGRLPFTYTFSGNMNLSLYSFAMPLSYTYSNMGGQLNYQVPFNFNRLSLNPKYKWISAYIGDAAMTFSPYTLAGHQFTGVGIELTPKSPLKFSAMYGRLLKAVAYDGNPNTIAAYKRMGYGTKLSYEKQKYKLGIIGFYAKDQMNSLSLLPTNPDIAPKENFVWSFSADVQLSKELRLYGDYSNSTVTEDLRAQRTGTKAGFILDKTGATQSFSAIKAGLDFKVNKLSVGGSFERVDPNYNTLGAYFFPNDLKNIMLNIANSFLKDKLTLSANVGVQSDNLDNTKNASTNRFVGTVNASAKLTEQLLTNFSFTNQSTTTNVRPNQFDEINQINPEINSLEQLRSRQLSQNATAATNYNFKDSSFSKKNVSLNYSFNQVANEQSGIVRIGQLSDFHNFGLAYNHSLIESKWSFTGTFNYTKNTIAKSNTTTFGPTLSVNKNFFKEKLTTQFSSGYNQSQGNGKQTSNIVFRLNSGYVFRDNHNFSLNATSQFRQASGQQSTQSSDFIIVFGYAYNFSPKKEEQSATTDENQKALSYIIKFKFEDHKLEGNPKEVVDSIYTIMASKKQQLPSSLSLYLKTQKEKVLAQSEELIKLEDKKVLQQSKLEFVNSLTELGERWNQWKEFDAFYGLVCKEAYQKLKKESEETSLMTEDWYALRKNNALFNYLKKDNSKDFVAIDKYIKDNKIPLTDRDKAKLSHYNLLHLLSTTASVDEFLSRTEMVVFLQEKKDKYYQEFTVNNEAKEKLVTTLEIDIVDFYFKQYKNSFSY